MEKINKKDKAEEYIEILEDKLVETGQQANKYFSNVLSQQKS